MLVGVLVIKLIHIWGRISVSLIGWCHPDRPHLRARLACRQLEGPTAEQSRMESSSTWCVQASHLQLSAGSRADLDGGLQSQREQGRWHSLSRAPWTCFNQDQKLTRDNHRSPPVFPVSYLPYHLSEIRGKCQDCAPVSFQFDSKELLLFFSFILNFTSMTDKGAPFYIHLPIYPSLWPFNFLLHFI